MQSKIYNFVIYSHNLANSTNEYIHKSLGIQKALSYWKAP